MIEPPERYVRMVMYMDKDLDYLLENLRQYETVLRNNFGVENYKKCENKLNMLKSNVDELKRDLKTSGLL